VALRGPAPTPPALPIAMDAGELAKYAGSYMNPPARVDLILRDGRLYFRRDGLEREAATVGDLRFRVPLTKAS